MPRATVEQVIESFVKGGEVCAATNLRYGYAADTGYAGLLSYDRLIAVRIDDPLKPPIIVHTRTFSNLCLRHERKLEAALCRPGVLCTPVTWSTGLTGVSYTRVMRALRQDREDLPF